MKTIKTKDKKLLSRLDTYKTGIIIENSILTSNNARIIKTRNKDDFLVLLISETKSYIALDLKSLKNALKESKIKL